MSQQHESLMADMNEPEKVVVPLATKLEELVSRDSRFGPYQLGLLFFLVYETCCVMFVMRSMHIANLKPTTRCFFKNGTYTDIDFCRTFETPSKSVCGDGGVVEVDRSFISMAIEWPETVCGGSGSSRLTHTMGSIVLAAKIPCTLLGGAMADTIGRYPAFITGVFLRTTGAIALIFVPSWQWYTAALFVGIFGTSMSLYPLRTLIIENLLRKHRVLPACFANSVFAGPLYGLIGYFSGSWRTLSIIGGVLNIPSVIFALCLMRESPRWLIENRKYERAANYFNLVKKINGLFRSEPPKVTADGIKGFVGASMTSAKVQTNKWKNCGNTLRLTLRLFSDKRLRWITTTVILLRIFDAAYGAVFDFSLDTFHLSPFLIIAIDGLANAVVATLVIYVDFKHHSFLRRRLFLLASALCIGFGLTLLILLSLSSSNTSYALNVSSAVFAICVETSKFLLWLSWMQVVAEYFPTNVRNNAYGFFYCVFAVSQSIAPQTVQLRAVWVALPFFIPLAILLVAVIIGYFQIPETAKIPQISSFSDLKAFDKQTHAGNKDNPDEEIA